MNLDEITELLNTHPELRQILEDTFGRKILLRHLHLKPAGTINTDLMTQVLEEYRDISGTNSLYDREELVTKSIPTIHIVWENGAIEKSTHIGYRCVGSTYDDWTGDCTWSGDMEDDQEDALPVGHHFTTRADVKFVALLTKRSHGYTGKLQQIDELSIQLFFPTGDIDIQATALDIMNHWDIYSDMHDFGDKSEV
jgi:hypothetical protein